MANAWPPLPESPGAEREHPVSSLEEWLACEDRAAGEWVEGRLEEEEVPDAVHELAVSWLVALFRSWLGTRGFVFGSELKLITSPNTGRKPDLAVFLPGTKSPPRRGPVRLPPDILVEVVTPSPRDERRDRIAKMAEYALFGVRYYWLVDPAIGSLEIFERTAEARYQKLVGVVAGRVEAVPGCVGLSLDVDALWLELARLGED
ncbi:MAG: Uma2 family endonuclease [Deltaproteobacteria bacterium]